MGIGVLARNLQRDGLLLCYYWPRSRRYAPQCATLCGGAHPGRRPPARAAFAVALQEETTVLIDSLAFTLEKSGCLDAFWGKLDAGEDATLGVAASARPFLVAARFAASPQPTLVVVAGEDAAVAFARNVAAYVGEERVLRFPGARGCPLRPQAGRSSRHRPAHGGRLGAQERPRSRGGGERSGAAAPVAAGGGERCAADRACGRRGA